MKKTVSSTGSYMVAEVELVYKSRVKAADRPIVRSTIDAYNLFFNFWNKNKLELQEQFLVMLLNRNRQVLGISEVSSGGTGQTIVDSKIVFTTALKAHASAVIIAHNHPSGELNPGEDDILLTKKLKLAGEVLDIVLSINLQGALIRGLHQSIHLNLLPCSTYKNG